MADLGSDLSCVFDCTPDMAEVSGRKCLAQAIARRYITPRGRLIYDPNYGFDLTQFVNDDLAPVDIARLQSNAESEADKDERVLASKVTATLGSEGVLIVVVSLTDSSGPFTFVLSVNQVTVEILSVKNG